MLALFIIIALVLIIVLWFISTQRKLVSKDELSQNSMSQIGVQEQSRWDAITSLVELTKSYNEHEYNTLRDVIAERREITGTSTAKDVNAQEDVMAKVMTKLNAVAEQYPDLKANENYAKTMDSVNLYENQVRVSRMVYNDSVTNYNKLVRQFPESLVAGMLHFDKKEYIQDPGQKAERPPINI